MTDVGQTPTTVPANADEHSRTGLNAATLQRAITDHLRYSIGRPASVLTPEHYYRALALAVRDRMQQRWIATTQTYLDLSRKVSCYLSAEFLMGPQLGNNLLNLHIEDEARAALAALGQDLDEVLKDFYELWPERFSNKTNGVTPRRFLALANPGLRELLDETIGDGWLVDLQRLRGLESYADDAAFRGQWRAVKRANKARLADYVHTTTGIELEPDWLFDIQVKRIHEYKRQHLNVLHIITLYNRLKQNPGLEEPDVHPQYRTQRQVFVGPRHCGVLR
jgi:glucan phosphorylase